VKSKTDKALKAFYGTRDVSRPQEVFTPASLVQPLIDVWGAIELDPCGHFDSPVSHIARETWRGEVAVRDDKGVPKAWDGPGRTDAWTDKTYCNPPFSELKAWLAHAQQFNQLRTAILMPARLQRSWLREFLRYKEVVALNSVKFHGYDQAFPQALLMVIS
jgi:hypothetical protein